MKTISIQLPDDTVDRLKAAAGQDRRSTSNLARSVLEDWLERIVAGAKAAENQLERAGGAAAAAHLAEHRHLGGLKDER
jgi:predicted transcriptional regulator